MGLPRVYRHADGGLYHFVHSGAMKCPVSATWVPSMTYAAINEDLTLLRTTTLERWREKFTELPLTINPDTKNDPN